MQRLKTKQSTLIILLDNIKKQAPSADLNNSLLKIKIKELKVENKNLKNQLLDLKIRLNSLVQRIDSFLN